MGQLNFFFTDFSDSRFCVDEVFALLGFYAACVGSGLPTCLPPKRRYTTTILRRVTTQNREDLNYFTIFFIHMISSMVLS